MHPDHELNRASWDRLAALHGQDAYYDTEALVAGASSLIEEEEAALAAAVGGDLAGVRVLHVQCHLGLDAITFARRGARVTGVDFSAVALERAAALARRCAVDVEWVRADVTDLPATLHGRFDLAWATMGILCWIADAGAWMRSVARTLAPGGRLVLMDGQPRAQAAEGSRMVYVDGRDYASDARAGLQVQFRHALPEIVSAAAGAGLRILGVKEQAAVSWHLCIEGVVLEPDGRYRRREDGQAQPVLFTLVAEK